MKIAVITDTHAGVKNGSETFLENAKVFYDEVFFPYCLKHKIKRILHLGDYFDHRKYVNIRVLSATKEMFIDRLREYDMQMDLIPGNHDVFYKNTNELCTLVEVLKQYSDVIHLHMKPTVVNYDGLDIALVPWINPENYDECISFIKKANAPFLGGHLELAGFEMIKGLPVASHGMDKAEFQRYQTVMSGHYHTKSTQGNIHYLGTPYELTWADANDPKYFHVIDTSTRELFSVRNKNTLFNKIIYDDSAVDDDIAKALSKCDFSKLKNTYVKVLIRNKKNPYYYDKYMDKLNEANPYEIKTIENFEEYSAKNVDEDSVELTDTVTLLNSYVDAVETDLSKDRIKTRLQELYIEAQNID
jgi:DNA repair exonuclease SbcCD nuclease subunit